MIRVVVAYLRDPLTVGIPGPGLYFYFRPSVLVLLVCNIIIILYYCNYSGVLVLVIL